MDVGNREYARHVGIRFLAAVVPFSNKSSMDINNGKVSLQKHGS